MTLDQVINLLVTVTLIEMMVAIGLSVTFQDIVGVGKNWRLVTRAFLANYVVTPAVTVLLLLAFQPHPMVALGFLILAACPGAPFAPPVTALAKGNVTVAVGLMVLLAGSSAVLAPVLLQMLAPLIASDEPMAVDGMQLATTLLATQLAPLLVGTCLRNWLPALAKKLQGPAGLMSKILNAIVVVLILYARFELLAEIQLRGFLGMAVLLGATWGAGWFLGGAATATRRAVTITTSLRNVGVGLVIASGSFAGTPAVTATLAYGLFEIMGSLLLALVWARRPPGRC